MASMTPDQEREAERLVREEGLTEEEARVLATERRFDVALPDPEKPIAPDVHPTAVAGRTHRGAYVDVDTDDEFLDLEEPRYEGGGTIQGERIDALLESGEKLPPLPPPTDR